MSSKDPSTNVDDAERQPLIRKTNSIEATTNLLLEQSSSPLQHTPSIPRSTSIKDLPPPPDGGQAWIQVFAGFLILLNTWGYINSYSLFSSYYTEDLGLDLTAVSWISSIQIFLVFFLGTFSGRAADAGFFRLCMLSGVVLQLVGIFATSFARIYWQLLLSQGIIGGVGSGLVFCPTISLIATYFSSQKTLALNTMASGTGVGGVVFPAIAQQLLPAVGFGWTVRVMGFVVLITSVIAVVLLKPRLPPRSSGAMVEWEAFKEKPYTLFTIGMFLTLWALYVAFSFVSPPHISHFFVTDPTTQITRYATSIIGTTRSTSLTIFLILNAMGTVGRILPGLLAGSLGVLNTMIPFTFLTSILYFVWIFISSETQLFVFAVVFGLIDSAVQGLVLGGLSTVNPDPRKMGTRSGMILSCVSIAALTGGPIFGALVERGGNDGKGFLYANVWGGCSIFVGLCFLVAARVAGVGWELSKKM
ncbi:hypothetical protein AC579_276 [Pseudocercospora musae]|uniref:Major facilitator superfamily (MFS) profile domain-containing protein n=1 Tax=Pseudocercospora musae TaxID=113226 RepID=A0A139I6D1_9PEZI|nr:hypothetical protein AC579_276 [Pseudocercospora musae]